MQNIIYFILFICIDIMLYLTLVSKLFNKSEELKRITFISILIFFLIHLKILNIGFLMHGERFALLTISVIYILLANYGIRFLISSKGPFGNNPLHVFLLNNVMVKFVFLLSFVAQIFILFLFT